jgi:hypothetical protein
MQPQGDMSHPGTLVDSILAAQVEDRMKELKRTRKIDSIRLLEEHLEEVQSATTWQCHAIPLSSVSDLSKGFKVLCKKYSFDLAHKLTYNKKLALHYLTTKAYTKWARVTLPMLNDAVDPWDPSDPCFACLMLDQVGEGNHMEFMEAWTSSIWNDVSLSLVVDVCHEDISSADPLRDALRVCGSRMG